MKLRLNIVASDAASNMEITLQHTMVHYATHTKVFEREVEIPDLPEGFAVQEITLVAE